MSAISNPKGLPRLVYLGDVPIEATYHGSTLLYRVLEGYPREKLLLIQTDLVTSIPGQSLAGAEYRQLRLPFRRLATTRLGGLYSIVLFLAAGSGVRRLARSLATFRPEAVLTVAHNYHWITAARLAEQLQLPLHLIIHDHPLQMIRIPIIPRRFLERVFCSVYRQAVTRFCVSPFMEAEYAAQFRLHGSVLYPSRSSESPAWHDPPERDPSHRNLRIAFAGSITSNGYTRLLKRLAGSLAPEDRLVLFGPHTPESLSNWQLEQKNIELGGLLPAGELLERLRKEFDVLFVPMSFDMGGHDDVMRLGFPSKIADYTATGVPLLVCGPEYCSAVQWARSNHPVAEVVASEDSGELATALSRLRSLEHRNFLARRALDVGERLFSHAIAESIFFSALIKPDHAKEVGDASKRHKELCARE